MTFQEGFSFLPRKLTFLFRKLGTSTKFSPLSTRAIAQPRWRTNEP
jgi:hypothetical protein